MINLIVISSILAGFLLTYLLMPFWIRKTRQIDLVWDDMNKISSQKVSGSGGIIVMAGFIFSTLLYIGFKVFYLKDESNILEILAILLTLSLLTGIGLIDDILGWKKGGLSRRSRLIMVLFAAVPLMVLNSGRHIVSLPFLGTLDLGVVYPLFFIPIGIVGASATFNFLAGFNGLEAGQGIILFAGAGIVSYFTGNAWLTIICLNIIFCLLAFLIFNFTPAKVFPGNSITLVLGGLFACVSIMGNFEKIAIFFFLPFVLETILKSRGKLVKQSFGKPEKDGSLDLLYPKVYGLTHLGIFLLKRFKIKPTEKRVVYLIWSFQILIVLLGLIVFREGIFL